MKASCLRGNSGRAPSFQLYPGIQLTTEEKSWKNLRQGSRKVPGGQYSFCRSSSRCCRDKLTCNTLRFRFRWVRLALGHRKYQPRCRTKGFPASSKFALKLCQGSAVVGKKRNSQILVNLPVSDVPRCTSGNATFHYIVSCKLFYRQPLSGLLFTDLLPLLSDDTNEICVKSEFKQVSYAISWTNANNFSRVDFWSVVILNSLQESRYSRTSK